MTTILLQTGLRFIISNKCFEKMALLYCKIPQKQNTIQSYCKQVIYFLYYIK